MTPGEDGLAFSIMGLAGLSNGDFGRASPIWPIAAYAMGTLSGARGCGGFAMSASGGSPIPRWKKEIAVEGATGHAQWERVSHPLRDWEPSTPDWIRGKRAPRERWGPIGLCPWGGEGMALPVQERTPFSREPKR